MRLNTLPAALKIGFVGPKEAGKTTAALILSNLFNPEKSVTLSFAGPLKELVSRVTPDGLVVKPRDRGLLQFLGTEYYRNTISDSYWTDIMRASVEMYEKSHKNLIIVDDCRFLNEGQCLHDLGFKLIKVYPPDWTATDGHSSETEWQRIACDAEIVNRKLDKIEYRTEILKIITAFTETGIASTGSMV